MKFFLLSVFVFFTLTDSLCADGTNNAILITDPHYAGFIKLHGEWGPWNGNPTLYQESQPISTIEFRAKMSGFSLAGSCYGAGFWLYVDGVKTSMQQFPNTAPAQVYGSVTFSGLDATTEHLYEIACVSGSSAVSTITPTDGTISTSIVLPDKDVNAYYGDSIELGQYLPDESYSYMFLHSQAVGRVAILVGAGGMALVSYGQYHTGDIPLLNHLKEVFVRYGTNDSELSVDNGTFLTAATNLLNNLRTHVGPDVQITQLPCLPESGFNIRNVALQKAVSSATNQANLRFIDDTANFDVTAGIDTFDGRHPNVAGSILLAGNLAAATNPPAAMPIITGQPTAQTVPVGASATFSVAASGSNPLSYQWQLNGNVLTGQTGAVLSLDNVTPEQAGVYSVPVSNTAGSAASSVAPLAVQVNFSQWAAAFFTPEQQGDPAISTPMACPQADGVTNLLKFFCDINPAQPMSASDWAALPTTAQELDGTVRYLTLTYRQNAGALGLAVAVQTSPGLSTANWQTVTPDVTENLPSDPSTGDPVVRVKINVTSCATKFVRLQITTASASGNG